MAAAIGAPWFRRTLAALEGAEAGEADLVVVNAAIYTVDTRLPRAEACAVKDGRFIAVGTNAEVRALAGKNTRTFDAKRMTIVPGFTDCHNHAGGGPLHRGDRPPEPGSADGGGHGPRRQPHELASGAAHAPHITSSGPQANRQSRGAI